MSKKEFFIIGVIAGFTANMALIAAIIELNK
jgi:hypothetical protein